MSARTTGAEMIAAERARQVREEGYSNDHDDRHVDGALARAAACYAIAEPVYVERRYAGQVHFVDPWPWEDHYDKRKDGGNYPNAIPPVASERRLDMLVKAGALLAAEIDRLIRAAADAADDFESEHDVMLEAICGRVLVGQGSDVSDPLCVLPRGHRGGCRMETQR